MLYNKSMTDGSNSEWMTAATCKEYDSNIFFPRDGHGIVIAQRICAKCPVEDRCLEYALDNHEDHGVWGGKSERERRRLLRERRIARVIIKKAQTIPTHKYDIDTDVAN